MDGGSEFMAQFEEACRREEFWECYDGDLDLPSVRKALHAWEGIYNHVRPHQGLAGKTPAEYLAQCHPGMAPMPPAVSYVVNEYKTLLSAPGTC